MTAEPQLRTLPLDIWLMTVDQTKDWALNPEDMQHVERIIQVLLVDVNEVTHCCEITPSYCFYPVETRAEYKDYIYEHSRENEQIQERIDSVIMQHADHDCMYMHCSTVDFILKKGDAKRVYHYGASSIPFADVPYDQQIESLIEHFNANQYL